MARIPKNGVSQSEFRIENCERNEHLIKYSAGKPENEQNLKFQKRFSQTGFILDKDEEKKSCLELHQN